MELPTNAVKIESYKGVEYNRYWYDYDAEKVIDQRWDGYYYIEPYGEGHNKRLKMVGIDGKRHDVYWKNFKRWLNYKWDMVYILELDEKLELRD